MEKQSLRWSTDGDPTLLVIEVPEAVAPFGLSSPSFGLPIMKRQGGLLVAVPLNAVDSDKLVDEMTSEGDGLLGPSKSFTTELTAEEEEGAVAYLGVSCRFMVIDFSDDILLVSREYSPEQDSIEMILQTLQEDEPKTWQEGAVTTGDPLLQVLAQQGSALTALVAHIAAGGDALGDLSTSATSSQSTSTKGVQRRERLQTELASGTSNFYHLLLQQLHRRLRPSRPLPADVEGFKDTDIYVAPWIRAGRPDPGQHPSSQGAPRSRHSSFGATGDRWGLHSALPHCLGRRTAHPAIYQDRTLSMHAQGRPFAPLVHPSHAAVAISYLKELEVLNSRKKETVPAASTPKSTTTPDSPSPRRRPRYPKKPKADAANRQ